MVTPLILAAGIATGDPLPPFAGDYTLLRNGREVGSARIEYRPEGDGAWRVRSRLEASALVGALRFTALEESRLRFVGGEPRSERFSGRREQPLRRREQQLAFDWERAQVTVRDSRHGESRHALPGPALDPLAALLRAALAAKRGEAQFHYLEVNRGAPKQRRGRIVGTRNEPVDGTEVPCILIERLSEDRDRRSESCHAPALGYAPVLILYADDGDELVLRLLRAAED
jgi:hypothetical protein